MHGDTLLGACGEEMARGQAERLMGLLAEVLGAADVTWGELSALAVGVGPGNFTGIRIGVSAARGLALGLGIPAYGVTGFEARTLCAAIGAQVVIPAPRDMVYIEQESIPALVEMARIDSPAPQPAPAALAQAIARVGRARWPASALPPAPLYIKAPDAAPARDAPPTLLP